MYCLNSNRNFSRESTGCQQKIKKNGGFFIRFEKVVLAISKTMCYH